MPGRRPGPAASWCWASTPAATRCSTRSKEMGYDLDREALDAVFARFKEVADKKGELSALDLEALMGDEMRVEAVGGYVLSSFSLTARQ